jgi:hypothetical protein
MVVVPMCTGRMLSAAEVLSESRRLVCEALSRRGVVMVTEAGHKAEAVFVYRLAIWNKLRRRTD